MKAAYGGILVSLLAASVPFFGALSFVLTGGWLRPGWGIWVYIPMVILAVIGFIAGFVIAEILRSIKILETPK